MSICHILCIFLIKEKYLKPGILISKNNIVIARYSHYMQLMRG